MKTFTYLTCLALALSPAAFAHCLAHKITEVQTKAAAEKKDVLLVFVGGDWDGVSKRVKEGTLSNEEFKKEADQLFVTQVMEFAKDPKETDKDLLTMRERYQVKRLPAIIQVDALGRPYGYANFRSQKIEVVLKHLKANIEKRVKRDAAFAKAKKAKGVDRAKALIEGLKVLPQSVIRDFYTAELAMISKADPKGETGYIARIEKAEALDQEQKRYQQLFAAKQFDKIVKLSKEESAKLKGEDAQRVSMFAIQALASQKKYDEAKKAIDVMTQLDPKTGFGGAGERYKKVIDRIKARNERQASAKKTGGKKKKMVTGPIVSKPVAVVTDIKQLHDESKSIDAKLKKATEQVSKVAAAQKKEGERIAQLTAELKALQESKAKQDAELKKVKVAADRLAKKSKMMKEVIENHEAMARRKREISELEKKAAELQKQAAALRKKAGEIKKGK